MLARRSSSEEKYEKMQNGSRFQDTCISSTSWDQSTEVAHSFSEEDRRLVLLGLAPCIEMLSLQKAENMHAWVATCLILWRGPGIQNLHRDNDAQQDILAAAATNYCGQLFEAGNGLVALGGGSLCIGPSLWGSFPPRGSMASGRKDTVLQLLSGTFCSLALHPVLLLDMIDKEEQELITMAKMSVFVVPCAIFIMLMIAVSLTPVGATAPQHKLSSCCAPGGWDMESMIQYQLASDFFIAFAYFSIPLELLYFISRTEVFPFWWVVAQFGAFIVLCGLTHLAAMWTYAPHSFNVMLTQTILKVLTALVSCATAISLVHIIPVLLHVKVRELFLRNKAEELNREMDLIRRQEEAGRHVRMLTQEIRRSLDRHTILAIMLEELGKTLHLENCTIWMPDTQRTAMELTHELKRRSVQVHTPVFVPTDDELVKAVQSSTKAVIVPADSVLGMASSHDAALLGPMVAVRLPLLRCSNFKGGTPQRLDTLYAVMVLGLPKGTGREWGPSELEIVETVSDQVAVALSHAAILEESHRIQDQLVEQNKALQLVRKEAETAVLARNEFLVVMNHEMRIPLHSIRALSSLLQEFNLSPEQRSLVETVAKSSGLMSNIINDMVDYSRLEDGSLMLEHRPFKLPALFREAANFAIPMARSKGIRFSLELSDELPQHVIGDEKRLLQVTLNLIENALKSTTQGNILVSVCIHEGQEMIRWGDHCKSVRRPAVRDDFVVLRTEVRDTGMGFAEGDISKLFQKFVQPENVTANHAGGAGLKLAVCQKIVQLMNGHIWVESAGPGLGSVVTFTVNLQLQPSSHGVPREETLYKEDLKGLKVLISDDNLINRTVTKQLLEKLGCQATVVESGRQCLATLAQPGSMYKLLILDLWMPEMDGYEVAIRIQKNIRLERRPLVVALTADTDKSTQDRCLKVGMDGVILKPVSLVEISSKLCKILLRAKRFHGSE
ncbi:hypothetical protein GOP47_0017890 [Adiantum capillus-veneris]|uniref:histidine kinase n=1 Tax=Adiantum capillus-veneris TaxID=13818 RepID=A0A9D4UGQ5_ADICA|nr:hypothetical protein GOP47_0017890 [Adiantum capillus-veneris]